MYSLGQLEYLAVDELKHSYIILRRVENLLQAIDDKQTQTLPNNVLDWQRLCYPLDMADEPNFVKKLIKQWSPFMAILMPLWVVLTAMNTMIIGLLYFGMCSKMNTLTPVQEQQIDDAELWPLLNEWHQTVSKRSIDLEDVKR